LLDSATHARWVSPNPASGDPRHVRTSFQPDRDGQDKDSISQPANARDVIMAGVGGLKADVSERNNLITEHPEIAVRLEKKLSALLDGKP
jgi:hypothetical protein